VATPSQPGAWGFRTAALAILTVVVVAFALVNLRQLWIYRQPTDGVLWRRTTLGLQAAEVAPQQSAVRRGDLLLAIGGKPVETPEAVARRLYAAGVGGRLRYSLVGAGGGQVRQVPVPVRAVRIDWGRYAFLEAVGVLYLAIGLFVFYRRRTATQALRFYLFCLASFVLYCFHFTGKLNVFDQTVFWANEAALLLTPALLMHFALRFAAPETPEGRGWRRAQAVVVYLPALVLGMAEVALATGAVWLPVTPSAVQDVLNRADYLLFAGYFAGAAVLFARRRAARPRRSQAETERRGAATARQAEVMAWGTAAAIVPFLGLYVMPYALGADLPRFADASVLSLVLVPLAFGYAIWRHELLEAEMVFRRGVVYTLATAAVVAAYWGVIGVAGVLIHIGLPAWGWAGWLVAILVTAILFEPCKRWLQERLDRMFYRERYDYRRTLIEFGRQMNAEPDLERLLPMVLERLTQTLELQRAAIFLAGERGFELARGLGMEEAEGGAPDFGFLDEHFRAPEAKRLAMETLRGPARRLQLHYYLPCQLQGQTVAILGLGRTARGEFLSSDDLALVETLAGTLAIALENARLYATLRQKADEYQRLKDFNENIVESVQVGVVATDLAGMVESWNAHMEALFGLPRGQAIGRPLTALLGEEFAREFARAAGGGGVHSLHKLRMAAGRGDGAAERIVNGAIAPLVTARFERVGQIVLLSDVTAEAEMERRLIQADRLRSVGLLAAGVAHEVNTPLAVISSYTQMLAKQTPAEDPRAAVLATITQQTFRASEIVGNLLNFSRTGAARFRRIEVNQVVRETLALVEHPLRSAGIHVISALHPEAVEVLGDAGKLQQVFLNLILNARDAMPRGGTLRLASGVDDERGGERARGWVTVEDSGEGIPEELHHRIFDPFFTTKAAARVDGRLGGTMSTGTGLGLAVTYGIVEEHGGAIRVESQPQRGAAFRIELPLLEPKLAPAVPVVA
jgi:two-component system NtrC family sensor kinase